MNDELMHFRTKGSKNGERRYQYEDGTLTPLGREHYGIGPPREKKADDKKSGSKSKSLVERFSGKKKPADKKAPSVQQQIDRKKAAKLENYKNLSDDELRARISRMTLEKDYLTAVSNYKSAASTEKFSSKLVKKFEDKAVDAIADIAVDTGKGVAKKFLSKTLNIAYEDKNKNQSKPQNNR